MNLTFSPLVPEFDGGISSAVLYNAGPMLADDRLAVTSEDCPMQLVISTNETEYHAYLEKLQNAGFVPVFKNHTPAVDSAQFSGHGILLYVYFTRKTGEVRIIEDRSGVSVDTFSYVCDTAESAEIYQYALYYDPKNGHSPTTTNCGMFYIIRLADNHLFLIDGGDMLQCSAEAVDGMYRFLRHITGTAEGEVISIAGWYFTHAHDDHMAACVRLLRTYPGVFDLQRVLFNFPSYQTRPQGYSLPVFILKETLREFCPGVKCLKLHTGEKFTLGNALFEVFYTHEDAVNAENPAVFPFGDFNCTSPILKMTTAGHTVLWLGDTNTETETLVVKTVPQEMWKSDVVQIAHHCFNYLSTLYAWIDADYAMLPNSYYGGHTVENLPKLKDVETRLASKDYLWYEDKTTGFRFEDGKYCVILEKERVGGEHDGTNLYGEKIG